MGLVLGLVCFFILLREKVVEAGGHLVILCTRVGKKNIIKKKKNFKIFYKRFKNEFFY